ncbi:hypothetical protein M406DRAFT_68404 [Cryphonectria parasitica EP155]|uniref:Uncharacterized protein n=1 Tax=Cryphonectria parasitica (strain ATCC 38755 / EP155) TaxID=660469 RepID=A0A9P5CPC6_CRYP1|nr:uncharacterized protein M406DRAFT_68404 [Cryphonectria parasitica EP155]KAF3766023.1 hypothetical protein M406DRAFT_68404 [Cryphonectria parasitica EP155]
MASRHSSRLARIFPCFHNDAGEHLSSPSNDHDHPSASKVPSSAPEAKSKSKPTRPARHMSTKQQAEAYIPTWQRLDVPDKSAATGRRKAASVSNGSSFDFSTSTSTSTESLESRRRHKRSQSEEGRNSNMLYFGDGTSPPPARRMFNSAAGSGGGGMASSSSTQMSSSLPARGGNGILTGRDASGYTATGMTSSNIMSGTYASLTYGGSLQANYAQNQSFGAGTGLGGLG